MPSIHGPQKKPIEQKKKKTHAKKCNYQIKKLTN